MNSGNSGGWGYESTAGGVAQGIVYCNFRGMKSTEEKESFLGGPCGPGSRARYARCIRAGYGVRGPGRRASRFLTGLVTCFARHGGMPAAAFP